LTAARAKFSADSYERVGLREIASDAGINVALVGRYFNSKADLFTQVLLELLDPQALMAGERETFGLRISRAFVEQEGEDKLQAVFVVVRAASSPFAQPILEKVCRRRFVLPFARWLGGKDAELRANFIATMLFGATLSMATEKRIRLSSAVRKAYMKKIAMLLQAWVDGREPVA
jgi:AcrR family transcriptional regulator